MVSEHAVVAIFERHAQAEEAVRTLAHAGFTMDHLSIVGKGYHSDEKVLGFYNIGDRVRLWGKYGAFWGALWGLFVSGVFMTIPFVGPVVVLGHLGAMLLAAVEGGVLAGGVSALAGALASIGIPKDAVLRYEQAVKADQFLLMVHGSPDEVERASTILQAIAPKDIAVHQETTASEMGWTSSEAKTPGVA
jgi:hypothetical protein